MRQCRYDKGIRRRTGKPTDTRLCKVSVAVVVVLGEDFPSGVPWEVQGHPGDGAAAMYYRNVRPVLVPASTVNVAILCFGLAPDKCTMVSAINRTRTR